VKRIVSLIAAGLMAAAVAQAATVSESIDPGPFPGDRDAEYLKLADTAAEKPSEAKWCELREMYPDTSFYREHLGIEIKKQTMEAGRKMLMDKTVDAVANFRIFMRNNAAAAGAHFYAAYLYNWNNDLVKQKMEALLPDFGSGIDYINPAFEKKAAEALVDCLLKTGDGRSVATAYQVVTVDEEEILTEKYFHVEPVAIDKKRENGHVYNVLTVQIPENKLRQDIYFQLDDRLVKGAIEAQKAGKLKPPEKAN
jgi:hypothetical protein